MTKENYMSRLEELLADMPEGDREDALVYYRDYFEEAGPDKEQQIIRELGSPERLALMIKGTSERRAESEGEFTEHGYQEVIDEEERVLPVERDGRRWGEKRRFSWALIVVLIAFASPLLLGFGGALLGIIVGLFTAIISIVVAVFTAGVGCVAGGAAGIASGITKCVSSPGGGLLTIGSGMLSIAAGILILLLFIWLLRLMTKLAGKMIGAIRSFWAGITRRRKGDGYEEDK